MIDETKAIVDELHRFIRHEAYPCVSAREAVARNHIPCLVVDHIACPKDDRAILEFIYQFVTDFRRTTTTFHSAAVIFRGPMNATPEIFDQYLWQRLQSLSILDAEKHKYDTRVDQDPSSPAFSFSLGEEAFFIIGLHPASERPARRFKYPAMIFNPHVQFEVMRKQKRYEKLKSIVRKRDILYSGNINPMLADFGAASEVYQYSGRQYDHKWSCPLKIIHGKRDDHSPAE